MLVIERQHVIDDEEMPYPIGVDHVLHLGDDRFRRPAADKGGVEVLGSAKDALPRATASGLDQGERIAPFQRSQKIPGIVEQGTVGHGQAVEILKRVRRPFENRLAVLAPPDDALQPLRRPAFLKAVQEPGQDVLGFADEDVIETVQKRLFLDDGGMRAADHDRQVGPRLFQRRGQLHLDVEERAVGREADDSRVLGKHLGHRILYRQVVDGAVDDEGLVAVPFDNGSQEGQVHRRPAGVAAGEITENSVGFSPGRIDETNPHDLFVPLYFLFVDIFGVVEGL